MKLLIQYYTQIIEINIAETGAVSEIMQQLRATQNNLAPDLVVAHDLQVLDASKKISEYAIKDSDTIKVAKLAYIQHMQHLCVVALLTKMQQISLFHQILPYLVTSVVALETAAAGAAVLTYGRFPYSTIQNPRRNRYTDEPDDDAKKRIQAEEDIVRGNLQR